ncbi:uncharacterized protein LOC111383712 [Olea europaea var. sylvestris]|uniref:uncharacterized protein LOC111383712 n=1 Tax=Olea europaea var. sylvestris TaxID=158386 RepID=UPI000C1CD12C|nr:uncharacterized protein LOC111383712 [Olea europaea var. sylvestris]
MPKNDLERKQMNDILYTSTIGSIMYAYVYIKPSIAFAIEMLGRYQRHGPSNKSTSRYVFMMMDGGILWKSAKQRLNTTSIMEAKPLRIYYDNSIEAFKAKNNKSRSQNKYIDIKYLVIREHVKEKKEIIKHASTNDR